MFDLNQIPPPSAVENTKTVLSESEFATDAVQSDFPAEHNNNTQHIEKILEAEKQPLMQPEQEMQASMPCSVQNNISETNFKDFAKESSDVTTPELSISAEHNSGATIKPVLWRLVVIAAELSAIVFMSYKLFF